MAMTKQIEWQKPSIDAVIVVGGGTLIDQYVVGNIAFISDLMVKLPTDIGGISVRAILLGAVALIAAKYFMK